MIKVDCLKTEGHRVQVEAHFVMMEQPRTFDENVRREFSLLMCCEHDMTYQVH